MEMTAEQKADYKLYRAECKFSNVEPVRKDFLAGDIPSCIGLESNFRTHESTTACDGCGCWCVVLMGLW